MRRAQQDALWRISPAVQRANEIAAHAFGRVVQIAAALEHDRLAMTTNIGDELYALCGANQCTPFVFLGQSEIVADLGH